MIAMKPTGTGGGGTARTGRRAARWRCC